VYLLALAIRNLLRAVDWAIRSADAAKDGARSKALRAAQAHFESEVPGAVKIRDVLQYIDGYERQSTKRRHKDVGQVSVFMQRGLALSGSMSRMASSSTCSLLERVRRRDLLGGLINEYELAASRAEFLHPTRSNRDSGVELGPARSGRGPSTPGRG
jgi:hypothetical protein